MHDKSKSDCRMKKNWKEAAKFYGRITLEDLQEFSRKAFLFYLKDEFISRFWRLANMEQYQNPEIYEISQANIHGRKALRTRSRLLQYDDTQWLFCKRGSANNGNQFLRAYLFFC